MINTAIIGYGVIGRGVAETVVKNAEKIAASAGDAVGIKYICDLRDFPDDDPMKDKLVKDFGVILNDPGISVVAEMIGGLHPAYDFSKAALEAGKSVVTSNKVVVAAKGDELLRIARENNVSYLYEASAGGAIPIIRAITDSLAGSEITEIDGILNGTTNYILTRMEHGGLTMEDALKEAQRLGYAEAHPEADIGGGDACRKICILAAAAFGTLIDSELVSVKGIENITPEHIARAKADGRAVRLIARAVRCPGGGIQLSVAPAAVRLSDPLASVSDVYNAVKLRIRDVGDMMFYGKGAGSLPTASAVVADMIAAAAGRAMPQKWDRNDEAYKGAVPDGEDGIFARIDR